MLSGCDISAYQTSIPAGKDFEILKATEGLTYDDAPFRARWATLAETGTLRGAYHFARTGNDPVAEADHFLRVVQAAGLRPGDLLVLDHETRGSSPSHDAAWALRWCVLVESVTKVRPLVYTYLSFAQEGRCAGLGRYPLWIADPSRPAGDPRVPTPWSSWVLHQYSETGGIDHDVFNGGRADWLALGGLKPAPQPPTEDDVLFGQVATGHGEVTPIGWPKGSCKAIGFLADNGLEALPAPSLRVAVHDATGWHVHHGVLVDSAKGKAVVTFTDPATTDGVSVCREDDGAVAVAWDAH